MNGANLCFCIELLESTIMTKIRISKSLIYLAAFLSFLFSVYLWFSGSKEQGMFVGLWVPSILSLGALMFAGRDR